MTELWSCQFQTLLSLILKPMFGQWYFSLIRFYTKVIWKMRSLFRERHLFVKYLVALRIYLIAVIFGTKLFILEHESVFVLLKIRIRFGSNCPMSQSPASNLSPVNNVCDAAFIRVIRFHGLFSALRSAKQHTFTNKNTLSKRGPFLTENFRQLGTQPRKELLRTCTLYTWHRS